MTINYVMPANASNSAQSFIAQLPSWARFFDEFESPTAYSGDDRLRELRMRLLNLRRRLRDGPRAPLRVAFFGPTGAGKSKLFSSLIGRNLSHSGYRRPFTRKAFYYLHDQWHALAAAIEGEVELHQDGDWEQAVLVDTPDFDSVEAENRKEAERVYLEADRFVFVTDALKYADASTWEYLSQIKSAEKLFCVVLNKTSSPAIQTNFHERFQSQFPDSSPPHDVVVPELPLDDKTLIDPDHPALVALRAAVHDLAPQDPREISAAMFRREARGLFRSAETMQVEVAELRNQIDELQLRLDQRFSDAKQELERRLSANIDQGMRDEVYQRVVKRLDKIDVLRYPRRIISAPFRGAKSLIQRWWGGGETEKEVPTEELNDPVSSETFHLLESELIQFANASRLDIIGQRGLESIIDRQQQRALRLSHEELKQLFSEHQERYQSWVSEHAMQTAAEITGENKFKFIVSQVLFNTVLITAQFQTGGALSFFELGVDSVISPFVAKAIGAAIGNEKVREFEQQAHEMHQRSLATILAAGRDRYQHFLEAASKGLDELEAQLQAIVAHAEVEAELVQLFESERSGGVA